jgi:Na+-transporting methylmalonyl-CoA/oxaloacetate decarboxylase gamma subunit
MESTNHKLIETLLFSVEGVGAVFVAIFLAAYLGGLPTTKVLDDEPAFRIPLQVFGAVLLVLILVTVVVAAVSKKQKQ